MSDSDMSARIAISPRFASASVAQSYSVAVTPDRATEITAKAERVTAKAEAHFEKHRKVWTNRQYGELLARDGKHMEFRPCGMADDRKAHLMRAADALVLQRQSRRLMKIDRAADRMQGNERDRHSDRQITR